MLAISTSSTVEPPQPAGHLNWVLDGESLARWVVTQRPLPAVPSATPLSGSKEPARQSIQGLTLPQTPEATCRQAADAVCLEKKHRGSVCPPFYAREDGADTFTAFRKLTFKILKKYTCSLLGLDLHQCPPQQAVHRPFP